eukprot:6246720-Prymnesium_polylepis.1
MTYRHTRLQYHSAHHRQALAARPGRARPVAAHERNHAVRMAMAQGRGEMGGAHLLARLFRLIFQPALVPSNLRRGGVGRVGAESEWASDGASAP